MKSYKTITGEASCNKIINKSKFIGYIKHIENEDDAIKYLSFIRKKHSDATHNCYAYSIHENNISRFSDDGEPTSTAGLPIFNVLDRNKITNCIIIVTRYFGGTLLGTGGLVHAYGSLASMTLDSSTIIEMLQCEKYQYTIDYKYYDNVLKYINGNQNCKIIDTTFLDNITITILQKQSIVNEIQNITNGNFNYKMVELGFFAW